MEDTLPCCYERIEISPSCGPSDGAAADRIRKASEQGDKSSGVPSPSAKIHKENESQLKPMVDLHKKKLWETFCRIGNEMIVTKPGRRIFPTINFEVTNLNKMSLYTVSLRFSLTDDYRYKYQEQNWEVSGKSDVIHDEARMMVKHPSSPAPGDLWMKKTISFKAIKITHHPDSSNGRILLHTMHRYRCEILLSELINNKPTNTMVFPLHLTNFIAVTSYQSPEITDLKVTYNPFAKGFRERKKCFDLETPIMFPYYPSLPPPYPIPSLIPPPSLLSSATGTMVPPTPFLFSAGGNPLLPAGTGNNMLPPPPTFLPPLFPFPTNIPSLSAQCAGGSPRPITAMNTDEQSYRNSTIPSSSFLPPILSFPASSMLPMVTADSNKENMMSSNEQYYYQQEQDL